MNSETPIVIRVKSGSSPSRLAKKSVNFGTTKIARMAIRPIERVTSRIG